MMPRCVSTCNPFQSLKARGSQQAGLSPVLHAGRRLNFDGELPGIGDILLTGRPFLQAGTSTFAFFPGFASLAGARATTVPTTAEAQMSAAIDILAMRP